MDFDSDGYKYNIGAHNNFFDLRSKNGKNLQKDLCIFPRIDMNVP
jgi:hypothetical protein